MGCLIARAFLESPFQCRPTFDMRDYVLSPSGLKVHLSGIRFVASCRLSEVLSFLFFCLLRRVLSRREGAGCDAESLLLPMSTNNEQTRKKKKKKKKKKKSTRVDTTA